MYNVNFLTLVTWIVGDLVKYILVNKHDVQYKFLTLVTCIVGDLVKYILLNKPDVQCNVSDLGYMDR